MRPKRTSQFSANYWPGFTDLVSSLLLLFIFLAFYQFFARFDFWHSIIIKAKQGQLEKAFLKAFPQEMQDSLITITSDGNLQRISYSNRLLFPSAGVQLKDLSYLDLSARIFKDIGPGVFKRIQVEGFTDSDPIDEENEEMKARGIRNNWDLSVARATVVVHRLQYDFRINPELLSATGYSWYQSRSNRTEADKARNRRIEIVLVYSLLDEAEDPKTFTEK